MARKFNGKGKRCTAKSKTAGRRCMQWVIPGKDKCRYHGGLTPIKHGRYSKYANTELADRIESFEKDANPKDLRSEIALLRAMISKFMDTVAESKDKEKQLSNETLIRMVNAVGKNVKRLVEIEDGLKVVIDVLQLQIIMDSIVKIIGEEVKDGKAIIRIGERLTELGLSAGGK